jgi:hypothetical protein
VLNVLQSRLTQKPADEGVGNNTTTILDLLTILWDERHMQTPGLVEEAVAGEADPFGLIATTNVSIFPASFSLFFYIAFHFGYRLPVERKYNHHLIFLVYVYDTIPSCTGFANFHFYRLMPKFGKILNPDPDTWLQFM